MVVTVVGRVLECYSGAFLELLVSDSHLQSQTTDVKLPYHWVGVVPIQMQDREIDAGWYQEITPFYITSL